MKKFQRYIVEKKNEDYKYTKTDLDIAVSEEIYLWLDSQIDKAIDSVKKNNFKSLKVKAIVNSGQGDKISSLIIKKLRNLI